MPKRTTKQPEGNKKKGGPRKKPRIAANGHKLPDPLPPGEILEDVMKRKWRLGKSIGVGGFGEIYLASDKIDEIVGPNATYVIKVEDHSNGPLFAEMHFYHRVGKTEQIDEWMKARHLSFLGMPRFIGSGSHEFQGTKYRFMVMDRFGEDLHKVWLRHGRRFPLKTVCTIGIKILDILEYIHSFGYIHADVKASNLLLGYGKDSETQIYLVDFGLACKYMIDNKHKEYKEDLRKAHDGTIEYTSRDAHIGAHARRSDLEILGYNMLHWLAGRLPWEDNLKDPDYVAQQKIRYLSNIPELLKKCFPKSTPPPGIGEYLRYVAQLEFEDLPNYNFCREILRSAIKKAGFKDDGRITFDLPIGYRKSNTPKKGRQSSPLAQAGTSSPRPAAGSRPRKVAASALFSLHHKQTASPVRTRKATSAAPGLRRGTGKPPVANSSSPLDNPTPAMLMVMQRKLDMQQAPNSANCIARKRQPSVEDIYPHKNKAPRRNPRRVRLSPVKLRQDFVL